MTEKSYFWIGTVTGDATIAPYDDEEFASIYDTLIKDNTRQGVLPKYLNALLITNPAGTTVRMASGAALVDGKLYTNDANIDFNANAVGNYYTLVLRKTTATQVVKAVLLGPSVGSYPTVTQVAGVTWEIAVAYILNTGGVLTITQNRIMVNAPFGAKAHNLSGENLTLVDGVSKLITFQNVEFDDAYMFDINSTKSRMTCKVAGRYRVMAMLDFQVPTYMMHVLVFFTLSGGATVSKTFEFNVIPNGLGIQTLFMMNYFNMTPGQYVCLWAVQNSGANEICYGPGQFIFTYDG